MPYYMEVKLTDEGLCPYAVCSSFFYPSVKICTKGRGFCNGVMESRPVGFIHRQQVVKERSNAVTGIYAFLLFVCKHYLFSPF